MNEGIENFCSRLSWAYHTHDLDVHRLFILGFCVDAWESNVKLRVTDLISAYSGTSRATTHRSIRSLIKHKLLKLEKDKDDKRVRYLAAGVNLSKLNTVLGGK